MMQHHYCNNSERYLLRPNACAKVLRCKLHGDILINCRKHLVFFLREFFNVPFITYVVSYLSRDLNLSYSPLNFCTFFLSTHVINLMLTLIKLLKNLN